jgi:hypothetical protein
MTVVTIVTKNPRYAEKSSLVAWFGAIVAVPAFAVVSIARV